jgi:hypothetical protein
VFTLPYIEQQSIRDKYDLTLAYNSVANGQVGGNIIPALYCPSGPPAKRHLDPNANVTTNPTTHYYGVMGPGGLTNPTATVPPYTVGSPNANGAWSAHGVLSHFQTTTGSVSTNRLVRIADIVDGTSNTLLLGEISVHLPTGQANQYRSWIRGNSSGSGTTKNVTYPINSTMYNGSNNFNDISFGSQHPGGCQFALGDGSVRFVSETINMVIYQGSASMNSGEVVSLDN